MTNEREYKKLTEWNPKKGDVFESDVGNAVIADTDKTARFEAWDDSWCSERFDWFGACYTLVSRATLDATTTPWIGWNGGECPVHPQTRVEVVPRDGSRVELPAHCVAWDDGDAHVIAYRVIEEHTEPRHIWIKRGPTGMVLEVSKDEIIGDGVKKYVECVD